MKHADKFPQCVMAIEEDWYEAEVAKGEARIKKEREEQEERLRKIDEYWKEMEKRDIAEIYAPTRTEMEELEASLNSKLLYFDKLANLFANNIDKLANTVKAATEQPPVNITFNVYLSNDMTAEQSSEYVRQIVGTINRTLN